MSKKKNLTVKQREILDFIKDYRRKYQTSPSQVEIGNYFKISTAAAHAHINRLVKKGIIKKEKFQHNSIAVAPSDARYQLVRNQRNLLIFKSDTLEIPVTEFEGYYFKLAE